MAYILIDSPPYPFFLFSGDALYRPGDSHRKRSALPCFDILFVEYGCLYVTQDGRPYTIHEHELLVLAPQFEHFGHRRCEKKTCFHWLHFATTEQYELADSYHRQYTPRRSFDYKKIEPEPIILPVFQKLQSETAAAVFSLLKQLDSLSINRYNHGSVVDKEDILYENRLMKQRLFLDLFSRITIQKDHPGTHSPMISIVIKYLETHYAEKITLDTAAAVAGCHKTHLIRCFNKEYGTTPMKVLTKIRIQRAKDFLSDTTLSCEAIAEQTGFTSSAYFSKVFKSQTGISPEKYRHQTNV